MARSLHPCAEPGCPELTRGTLCTKHERARRRKQDARRGNAHDRGYDYAHRKLRRQIARVVAAGDAICVRCDEPILPNEPWDLGHDDDDRTRYAGPEHQRCNRATAGRDK